MAIPLRVSPLESPSSEVGEVREVKPLLTRATYAYTWVNPGEENALTEFHHAFRRPDVW